MEHRTFLFAALLAVGALHCSDDTAELTPLHPPDAASDAQPVAGPASTFLLDQIYFESTSPSGVPDDRRPGGLHVERRRAWQSLGFDRDDQITKDEFSKHCKPREERPGSQLDFNDGYLGIDNAFGQTIVGLIELIREQATGVQAAPDLDSAIRVGLATGDMGLIIDMAALGEDPDYRSVDARLFGARLGADGAWRVTSDSLTNPGAPLLEDALASATAAFPNSYVTSDRWVSSTVEGAGGRIHMRLRFSELESDYLDLEVFAPVLSFDLSPDRVAGHRGIFSGILSAASLATELERYIQRLDATFCDQELADAFIENITNAVLDSADILLDGTQDPDELCDGISIGFGFEGSAIDRVVGIVDTPVEPEPCAP
ncbi:MAG: hypothetical protein U0271_34950 [Polyangiaceae bacterium]